MIGLRLAFSISLASVGFFNPVACVAQPATEVARIGYLGPNRPLLTPTCERPSCKECVTSVTSRAATS
jgi:hypothetical protein